MRRARGSILIDARRSALQGVRRKKIEACHETVQLRMQLPTHSALGYRPSTRPKSSAITVPLISDEWGFPFPFSELGCGGTPTGGGSWNKKRTTAFLQPRCRLLIIRGMLGRREGGLENTLLMHCSNIFKTHVFQPCSAWAIIPR